MARLDFRRLSLAAALAIVGGLAACGPGPVKSTTVVLVGPPDKVQGLINRHKLLGPPVQARVEPLDGGRQRATLNLPKGLPLGEVVQLGKDAARDGVNFEFSSGTQWGEGTPAQGGPDGNAPEQSPAKRKDLPVV